MMLSDTSTAHMPCLAGCDPAAQQLFRVRYLPVLAFLQTHLAVTDEWGDILAPEVRTTLHTRFLALEQRVIQSRLGHRERDTAAHWHYRRTYLIPLAQALDFFDAAEARHTAMTQALQHIQHAPNQLLRPALDVCDARFTNERQARVFVDAHICADMPTARTLARTMIQNVAEAERRAANRARSLVLAAIAYGWVGLLEDSDYPHTAPLVLLQAQADLITRLSDDPLATLATLRADLIALHHVLQPLHVVWKEPRQPYRKQKLWVESLLHRPPDDPLREQYRQRLTEEMRQTVVQNLARARGCYTGDASDLFEMFHHDGLPILIDWRCQIAALTSQRVLVQQRLAQAVVQHLAALHQRHRQEIIRLVEALAAACQETGVHLPLPRLLSEYPSSRYRRSLGRRLPFGFGAMAQRRMRRRKRRRVWLGRR